MENNYTPTFDLTNEMINISCSIMEKLGRLSIVKSLDKLPWLRKDNRISSIHSSLAIEGNKLLYVQVRDIYDDKDVTGSKDDIVAVKNAIKTYKEVEKVDPYKIDSLLKLHGIMMKDLIDQAGQIRTKQVGVFDE